MSVKPKQERRRCQRVDYRQGLEFIFYFDAFKARSVNLSKHGVRFETDFPIQIKLNLRLDGKEVVRDALLVWAERTPGNAHSYGLEFVEPLDEPVTGE
jgi:hypothetical protein